MAGCAVMPATIAPPARREHACHALVSGSGETDATDAHAIVMVSLGDKGLREVSVDPELTVLRLLCDRRDELSRGRAQALNRMHRLFLELLPGGAPVKKSASQYKTPLATVRPHDPAGKMRRPGRALRGDSDIQRGRPFPGHRLLGSVTFPDPRPRRYP
jgi:hypothetical protein